MTGQMRSWAPSVGPEAHDWCPEKRGIWTQRGSPVAQSCETQQGAPPCRAGTRGFWPPKAQGARSVVLRLRSPKRKLTTPSPPNKDPAPGPQGTGPAGFRQICSTTTKSKDQGSPRAAPGREAEARSAQRGPGGGAPLTPSSQSPWPRGRAGQAERAATQRPAQSSSTGDTGWLWARGDPLEVRLLRNRLTGPTGKGSACSLETWEEAARQPWACREDTRGSAREGWLRQAPASPSSLPSGVGMHALRCPPADGLCSSAQALTHPSRPGSGRLWKPLGCLGQN